MRESPTRSDRVAAVERDDDEAQPPASVFYPAFGVNAGVVEEIRDRFQLDPGSVDSSWRETFVRPAPDGARELSSDSVAASAGAAEGAPARAPDRPRALAPRREVREAAAEAPTDARGLQRADRLARVLRLIHAYRARGHRIADSDPLEERPTYFPELDPAHYGLGHDDLERPFTAGDLPGGSVQTLRQILDRLRATYCGKIGAEYMHVQDPGRKAWLRERMEERQNRPEFDAEQRHWILDKLSQAELFERFLHTKFLGQKRFSLEGAETLIPMLDAVVERAPRHGIREIVLGMSHRGRLNVLANVLGKSYEAIFSEFEDSPLIDSPFGSGDVKYHKGFSADRRVRSGERVHLTLTSNPSHLEAVNPVVEGRARAKQVRARDGDGQTIVPVMMHGDAAFAGQGIVAETLNLSQLRGYCTGGTLHIIVNNQIGFTTTPSEARSTLYCSDVAKMIQVPILHVNGDDPEAALYCVDLALEYRQRFGDDVVIDLVCYRRHGHNEGDEPAFTQPRLYAKIRRRPSVRQIYSDRLLAEGVIDAAEAIRVEEERNRQLQQALQGIKSRPPDPDEPYDPHGPWKGFSRIRPPESCETGVARERLAQIAEGIASLPEYFHVHPKLKGLLEKRGRAIAEAAAIDWAMGEALAFGSMLLEGTPIRLSGQDSSRGTFSHRHAVLVDQDSGEEYVPLDHLAATQARFEVYDSLLSEAAVLGFEYGYSLADPSTLVLWEAQFGDFANGAQVIIDQFIVSAHVKWGRMSGLVMLLPHGYEGQGPEHSSARIERFLQICAEDCLQVANCTNPAQYFHLLRRQMRRAYRAPLVIFTPKSLLRSPLACSRLEEFERGSFQPVIDDAGAERAERVLFCSGKVYYDLLAARTERLAERVAIVRVEELYPWPEPSLAKLLARHASAQRFCWVQEEPANMGAWTFVRERLAKLLPGSSELRYAGRPPAASTAAGSMRVHRAEQAALVEAAFEGL